MPRIRTLKPEFWGDEKLAPLPAATRLVFLGLISMADDAGRLVDSVRTIDGFIFPETEETAREALDTLASLGRILRYRSESGQRLIQLTGWKDHQRVDKPSSHVLPAPLSASSDATTASATLAGGSRESREDSSPRPTTNDHGPGTNDPDHGPTTDGSRGDSLSLELVRAANRGMLDNPLIGERVNPIHHGHTSAVELDDACARADIAPTFAISWVYQAARAYRPEGRNRQIRSLTYFRDGLLTAWEKHLALEATDGARPAAVPDVKPIAGRIGAGGRTYLNAMRVLGGTS